jgi:hypothetical protein
VPPPRPLLAATLIVRDESATLPACLASVADLVDEMVVYDTGSQDDTPAVARAAGARVLHGYWDRDFARARNAALEMTRAQWVLSLDADERLEVNPQTVRRLLAGVLPHEPPIEAVDGFLLQVSHVTGRGEESATQAVTRLFRPDRQRWQGRVHEILSVSGAAPARYLLPSWMMQLRHVGYRDAHTVSRKAERNLELAQVELDALVASGSNDRDTAARVLLDLARSFLGVGRRQDGVDALEALRDVVPGGRYRAQATAMLAQILLDADGFEQAALVLEAELRGCGLADPRLTDWIRARALAALGDVGGALGLLRGIDGMVDPAGTPQPMGPVLRARAVLATRLGRLPEAREALFAAMTTHGAVAGNGQLLWELFDGRHDELTARLRSGAGPYAAAVLVELTASGGPRWPSDRLKGQLRPAAGAADAAA